MFIPQLFAPLRLWQQDFAFEPSAPALMALLTKYQPQTPSVSGLERTVLQLLGLDVTEQLPWAVLRHDFESGGMYARPLLCADPLCLQSGEHSVVIHSERPQLMAEETESLLTTLNQHLAQDGLVLKAFHPQRWYLHALDDSFEHPLPRTTPLPEVGRGNVFPFLPQSADKYWQQLFSELQMLLYTHPVNQVREETGQAVVNGVWFWGEGDVETPSPQPLSLTGRGAKDSHALPIALRDRGGEGNDLLTAIRGGGLSGQVLAHFAGCRWSAQPAADFAEDHTLVILDQLQEAGVGDQPGAWQAAMNKLDVYLQQLLEALRSGRCEVVLYDTAGRGWQCLRPKGWFFRGRKAAEWAEFC